MTVPTVKLPLEIIVGPGWTGCVGDCPHTGAASTEVTVPSTEVTVPTVKLGDVGMR